MLTALGLPQNRRPSSRVLLLPAALECRTEAASGGNFSGLVDPMAPSKSRNRGSEELEWLRLGVFRRGTYIGSGENHYSAIHLEELAEFILSDANKAEQLCLQAAGENFCTSSWYEIVQLPAGTEENLSGSLEAISSDCRQPTRNHTRAVALVRRRNSGLRCVCGSTFGI